MQKPLEQSTYAQVISVERLVASARGTRTPCLYYELKHHAINRDSDWRPVVRNMTQCAVLDRIKWCEVFIGDILILRRLAEALEQRTMRLADLAAPVGSPQHVEAKLRLLLAKGENAVIQSDVCEDVLLRALRRMLTLADWSYTVSSSFCKSDVALRNHTDCLLPAAELHAPALRAHRPPDEGVRWADSS